MKVALIGSTGQLGTDLTTVISGQPGINLIPLTHNDIEIQDYESTSRILAEIAPAMVINTAAYHDVDACEDDSARAFAVNAYAVRNLALICKSLDAALLHISSDYVFGGNGDRCRPYTELDPPYPINAYGISKLAGEYFIRYILDRYWIVRTSGLYGLAGSSGKRENFVELMLRLAQEGRDIQVVNDQTLTPTYTLDLSCAITQLVQTQHYGVFHITNGGSCSWYEFAARIFELVGLEPPLMPTTTAEFGARALRPAYSVLANQALVQAGLESLRPWECALEAYLAARSRRSAKQ